MLYVFVSISTKTGTAPYWITGETVVGNAAATVITSSPGLICRGPRLLDVRAMKARRLAEDPEFTKMHCFEPMKFARPSSNTSVNRPWVNQNSKDASTRPISSFSSKTLPAKGYASLAWDKTLMICMGQGIELLDPI